VSLASGVPLDRAETAFPFNLLAGVCPEAAPGDLAFFVVAMLLFPHAACDKMTGVFSVHPQERQEQRRQFGLISDLKLVSFFRILTIRASNG
jgi:hypothetical protein